jgi:hypothetical protein
MWMVTSNRQTGVLCTDLVLHKFQERIGANKQRLKTQAATPERERARKTRPSPYLRAFCHNFATICTRQTTETVFTGSDMVLSDSNKACRE